MTKPRVATVLATVPKLSTAELFALLENPPFTGGTSKPLYRAVIAKLAKDPSAKQGMVDLSKRYTTIEAGFIGDFIADALARAAEGIGGKLKPAKKTSLDDVFAQIVAAPDDDGPRLVYADMLIEKGKSRGELIVLQVNRAAGRATAESADKEREDFILGDPIEKFAVPLMTCADAVTFHRGFPFAVHLDKTGLLQVANEVAWGTVRKLTGMQNAPVKPLLRLLASEHARNIVHGGTLDANLLAKLPAGVGATWTTLELDGDNVAINNLARFAAVRTLVLSGYAPVPAKLLAAFSLESLVYREEIESLPPLPRLKSLELRYPIPPAQLPATLESLDTGIADLSDATEYLRALPALKMLRVANYDIFGEDFSWKKLATVLKSKHSLDRLVIDGYIEVTFERTANGITLVLPVGHRSAMFYVHLAHVAKPMRDSGVTRVVMYPEEPRHSQKPFSDAGPAELAAVEAAWKPLVVEKRDAFTWPGEAVGEGWMLNRDRCCPSR